LSPRRKVDRIRRSLNKQEPEGTAHGTLVITEKISGVAQ